MNIKIEEVTYKIIKKESEWIYGEVPGKGWRAKIETNSVSRSFEVGKEYTFSAKLLFEKKLKTKVTVFPLKIGYLDSEEKRKQVFEIERWLAYVEGKASTGFLYERGLQECQKLGIEMYPQGLARLDTACKTAEIVKSVKDVENLLRHIENKLESHWYKKADEKISLLRCRGYDTSMFEERLEIWKQNVWKQKLAGYEGQVYHLFGGSGYCHSGWTKGRTVENSKENIGAGGPKFLYVLYAEKEYYQAEGWNFGVGDEQGVLYHAICRAATVDEAAPLKSNLLKREREKNAKKGFDYVRKKIISKGEKPKGISPWPEGQIILNTFNIYGSGECFVIGRQSIWYIENNGNDGDSGELNNVRTGGAGAIGWRIKYSQVLATMLAIIEKRLVENGEK